MSEASPLNTHTELKFQTRDLTSMDIWLLICMLFVALALFEYAIMLTIRFGKQDKNRSANKKGTKEDIIAEMMCRRIDRFALRVFLAAHVATVSTYFYVVHCKV